MTPKKTDLILRPLQTIVGEVHVGQRLANGYINLTQIADASGKLVADWLRLNDTQEYLEELSLEINIPASSLILVVKGGGNRQAQGTTAHPIVALNFIRWCSPRIGAYIDANYGLYSINQIMSRALELMDDPEYFRSKARAENYLYVLRQKGTNKVKIGVSSNMKARLSHLRSSSGFAMEEMISVKMECAYEKESALHGRYASQRLHGEWFSMNDAEIDSLVDELRLLE